MADIIIRPYGPSDEPAIRALAERLTEGFAPWRSPEKVRTTIEGWIDAALAKVDSPDHHVLVAADPDADVVGFLSMHVQDHYIDGRDGYIGELAVDQSHEGRGIGGTLLAEAEAWARGKGCERITLQTGAANAGARRFYERLGFLYEDVSFARPIAPSDRSS